MNSHSALALAGVNEEEGSSSASTGGSESSPIAMLMRWRLPPERRSTRSAARSCRPVCSSIAATAARGPATRSRRANSSRFSATESRE